MAALALRSGDDESFLLAFVDAAGAPQNLTGWTVWVTVKTNKSGPDSSAIWKFYWISGGASLGLQTVNATLGTLRLPFAPADTADKDGKTYAYDVQVKTAGNKIKTWDEGSITIAEDLTQGTTAPLP